MIRLLYTLLSCWCLLAGAGGVVGFMASTSAPQQAVAAAAALAAAAIPYIIVRCLEKMAWPDAGSEIRRLGEKLDRLIDKS